MQTVHSLESCDFCKFCTRNKKILKDHVYERHAEVVMVHTMAGQINEMNESLSFFNNFKTTCENTLKSILENQNALKQELFLIRNHLYEKKHHDSLPLYQSSAHGLHVSKRSEIIRVELPPVPMPTPNVPSSVPQAARYTVEDSKTDILYISDMNGLVDKKILKMLLGKRCFAEKFRGRHVEILLNTCPMQLLPL